MCPISVTVDTNNLAPTEMGRLRDAARELDIEFAHVSVSDREMEGFIPPTSPAGILETGVWDESRWGRFVWGEAPRPAPPADQTIPEAWILDESPLGEAVLSGADEPTRYEQLLRLISRGSFPPSRARNDLTAGYRRHLRDAMIISAHIRDARDILVSNDWARTPSNLPAVRDLIAQEFPGIRIMTADEFIAYCGSLR